MKAPVSGGPIQLYLIWRKEERVERMQVVTFFESAHSTFQFSSSRMGAHRHTTITDVLGHSDTVEGDIPVAVTVVGTMIYL